ncbi:aspartate/glutamate racemase family protein [Nitratireductor sp. GZWM139]|uniref:aspartate/glutamate racemase family protein n=1 Tax=Nitratireductor sp. GZWM139 TaxID=2950541 RepID=UPI0024BDBAF6|nr:aspartate/glutamate racemase family protein [Nitratireductor sp. GZWM139]MDJ1466034.1 aspartate/glutamate racemase family protein [Nitratireductor sp. GZWM139]
MKLKIINPNTTWSMTNMIGAAAARVARPETQLVTVSPKMGPASIEGHYDEAFAAIGVLDEVLKGEAEGVDAHIVACFGDPGLLASREVARGPVIGIAEAAMKTASFVSTGFSVISTLARSRVILEHLVNVYGMSGKCRSVRASNLAVLDLERPDSNARTLILEECLLALREDHSDCILLGCAGMADLAADISQELGVPVIDGVTAAVKMAEALVEMKVSTSKAGGFATPLPKAYAGAFARFAPSSDDVNG